VRPAPHSEEWPVPKPPVNLTFNDDSSGCDEDHGQQEGQNFYFDPNFEASFSSS